MSQDEPVLNLSQDSATFGELTAIFTSSQMHISSQEVPDNAIDCPSSQNSEPPGKLSQEPPDVEFFQDSSQPEARTTTEMGAVATEGALEVRGLDSRSFSAVLQQTCEATESEAEKARAQQNSLQMSQSSFSTAATKDCEDPQDEEILAKEASQILSSLSNSQALESDEELGQSLTIKGGIKRSLATSTYGRVRRQNNYMDMLSGKEGTYSAGVTSVELHGETSEGRRALAAIVPREGGESELRAGRKPEADVRGKGGKPRDGVKRERKRPKIDAVVLAERGSQDVCGDDVDHDVSEEEREIARRFGEKNVDVQFGELLVQTSNIKVSFTFGDGVAVEIDQLCGHMEKNEMLRTDHFAVKVKEKSKTTNTAGRTYFGGVFTITMDVWANETGEANPEEIGAPSNTCVRLFGYKDADPEKRHKAQFNGSSKSFADTLRFFREVFGVKYQIKSLRVEPNSVFSATDNAVMDPSFGLDMDKLEECLTAKGVQSSKSQVTGGMSFSFNDRSGRHCKPTVQKSGSVQLMLVDAPRRIRLETLRFLLEHCSEAIVPMRRLGLTRRTIEKRVKARNQQIKALNSTSGQARRMGTSGA